MGKVKLCLGCYCYSEVLYRNLIFLPLIFLDRKLKVRCSELNNYCWLNDKISSSPSKSNLVDFFSENVFTHSSFREIGTECFSCTVKFEGLV